MNTDPILLVAPALPIIWDDWRFVVFVAAFFAVNIAIQLLRRRRE